MHCHFGNLADIDAIRDKSPAVSPGISPRKATAIIAVAAVLTGAAAPLALHKVVLTAGKWSLWKRIV